MKLIEILALMMVLVCNSVKGQHIFENGERLVHYIAGSSEEADKFKTRINTSKEYHRVAAEPGRFIRAATNGDSSEKFKQNVNTETSKPYYFDYLVKENPNGTFGNLHFHIQEKYENGTVKGSYGYSDSSFGYIEVHYLADEKGYRATIEKKEHFLSHQFGLHGLRTDGKVQVGEWGKSGLAGPVQNLYSPGSNNKSDEEE